MASATPAARYSGYLQIKQAGVVIGLFPVPVGTPCDKRAWKDTPENRANLRPTLPTYDNVQYVPSGCGDLTVQVPEATKCIALAIVRVKDANSDYLSLLASGSGTLIYELIGLGGTATPNPAKKVFDTASGPFAVPSAIGSGTVVYGGFYASPDNGDYRLKIYDDAGGTNTYTIGLADGGPVLILKGAFGSPGGGSITGPVTPTDTPEYTMTGAVFISKSSRSDLMNLNVITGQDANGDWTYIIRDPATGNFPNKRYQGVGRGMMSRDQLHAGRYYGAYPGAVSCTEDDSPSDAKAHCTQKIQAS